MKSGNNWESLFELFPDLTSCHIHRILVENAKAEVGRGWELIFAKDYCESR
jgi:hypothetical protein